MESETDCTQFDAAFRAFLRAYPSFESTRVLDELRSTEYERLDRCGHIYLDYTGGGLYAISQLQKHHRRHDRP
jgi:molybdenum cofactor sulfurtransferase